MIKKLAIWICAISLCIFISDNSSAKKLKLTGQLKQLTFNKGMKGLGSWSPDAHWIVYSIQTGERQFGIRKVNVLTGDNVQLTQSSEEQQGSCSRQLIAAAEEQTLAL